MTCVGSDEATWVPAPSGDGGGGASFRFADFWDPSVADRESGSLPSFPSGESEEVAFLSGDTAERLRLLFYFFVTFGFARELFTCRSSGTR